MLAENDRKSKDNRLSNRNSLLFHHISFIYSGISWILGYPWVVMGSSILKVGSNLTVWFRTVHEYFEKKKTLLSSRLESLRERFELSIRTLRNVSGTCKYNRTLTIYRFESFMITYFNREFSIRCECVICFR